MTSLNIVIIIPRVNSETASIGPSGVEKTLIFLDFVVLVSTLLIP